MFTLQILDAGQTFLHVLGDRPVTLGAGDAADLKLREEGVAPMHVRFEAAGTSVRLTSLADVLVNGQASRSADLQLGDRVEIGRAAIVLGRTVSRRAAPADVLADGVRSGAVRSARARRKRPAKSRMLLPLAVVLAVSGLVGAAVMQGEAVDARGHLAFVESLVDSGKLAKADDEMGLLRRRWANGDLDRVETARGLKGLDRIAGRLVAIRLQRDTLLDEVRDPSDSKTYAQWAKALQALEAQGSDRGVAARKVRSQLGALLRERRDARVVAARANDGVGSSSEPSGAGGGQDPAATSSVAMSSAAIPPAAIPPLGLLPASELPSQADAGTQLSLRDSEASLFDAVGEGTGGEAVGGEAVGGEAVGAELASATAESPSVSSPESSPRDSASQNPQGKAPKPSSQDPEADRLKTLASLRSHMDRVRAAEESCDYRLAAGLLREASAAVVDRDPEFAARLGKRAAEAELLAGWHRAVVAALSAGKTLTTTDSRGRSLELVSVREGRIVTHGPDGEGDLDWLDIDANGMTQLVAQIRADGSAALGAAALLFRQAQPQVAESLLLGYWKKDKPLRASIDAVVARGRREPSDTRYELRDGAFVSLRQLAIEKRSKQLRGKLVAALRNKDPQVRSRFVAETVDGDPMAVEALAAVIRTEFDAQVKRVAESPLRKKFDRLAAEREALDAARDHARELIYDTVRYFYPYRPPAVSGERFAEYNRVQAEVDDRVEALRRLWRASRIKVRVPAELATELAQLDWLAAQGTRFGGFSAGPSSAAALEPVAWARALEPGQVVTLQGFATSYEELRRFREWQDIEAYNVAMKPRVPIVVYNQLSITNSYRRMFGHRPLAIVDIVCDAAQGHADEMSKLGYFSHSSPTPGRVSPTDRMRLAGYNHGVSENIARSGGAQAAHNAWCRSSGHHRNLLNADHREVGIGANGRYWVQNFGRSRNYQKAPEWPAANER
ncbi:MAG: CAP domain-containing protein [Planctomycetota bacterium]